MTFRVMLAPQEDPLSYPDFFKDLKKCYPLSVSAKYDGIRGVIRDGVALSRTSKPLPSQQIKKEFTHLPKLDGEFIEGNPTDIDTYNRTQSHVMSKNKPGDMHYYVFDVTYEEEQFTGFEERLDIAKYFVEEAKMPKLHLIEHELVRNEDDLLEFEQRQLALGFEGIMMRDPTGRYKHGRGTFKEGLIYKLKRFKDAEAVVICLEERMQNTNVQERDERGYAKRSSAQAGMVPAGTTGKFIVSFEGQELPVAPGSFTHAQLQEFWDNPKLVVGKILKFRYFAYGVKDKPRFPRASGLRDPMDM